MEWNYHLPTAIVFGEGERKNLTQRLKDRNLDRVLLVADPYVVQCGLADKIVTEAGGLILGVFSDVRPNPGADNVDACASKAKELGAACFVAVGGGSIIDCTKAAAACVAMDCGVDEILSGGKAITAALPVVAVPTTSGSGSEVSRGSVLSSSGASHKKSSLFSTHMYPVLAIVDPELTYSCPPAVTAASGMDVMVHALDSLSNFKATPITSRMALYAAQLVWRYLEAAYEDGMDKEARHWMSLASMTVGLSFSQTGSAAAHACSYYLTSNYNIPHGEACAFTMDAWYPISAKVRPELHAFASEMGFRDAEDLSNGLNALKKKLGLRMTLADMGVSVQDVDTLVEAAMASHNMANNIVKISPQELKALFLSKARG